MQIGSETQLEGVSYVDGQRYVVRADGRYNRRVVLHVPLQDANLTAAQVMRNKMTCFVRVAVKWSYMEVKLYWTTSDFKRKRRVRKSAVGPSYASAMVLHNI